MTAPGWPDLLLTRIGRGADAAQTYGTLAESLGVSRRVVEASVETLRRQGWPLVTGNQGCYLTDAAGEAADMAERLRRRAISQLLTARSLRATARRMQRAEQRITPLTLWADVA